MKTSKRNQWLSFLLTLIMIVGLLPLSVLTARAESGGEETGTTQGIAQASATGYPALTNLVEGTEILHGYGYFFYKNGKVDQRLVSLSPEKCRTNKNSPALLRA